MVQVHIAVHPFGVILPSWALSKCFFCNFREFSVHILRCPWVIQTCTYHFQMGFNIHNLFALKTCLSEQVHSAFQLSLPGLCLCSISNSSISWESFSKECLKRELWFHCINYKHCNCINISRNSFWKGSK